MPPLQTRRKQQLQARNETRRPTPTPPTYATVCVSGDCGRRRNVCCHVGRGRDGRQAPEKDYTPLLNRTLENTRSGTLRAFPRPSAVLSRARSSHSSSTTPQPQRPRPFPALVLTEDHGADPRRRTCKNNCSSTARSAHSSSTDAQEPRGARGWPKTRRILATSVLDESAHVSPLHRCPPVGSERIASLRHWP